MDNMVQAKNWILAITATCGSAVIQALGGWDVPLKVLIFFMGVDIVTGFMVAALWHKSRNTPGGAVDSHAGAKGLAKKMVILMYIGLAAALDRLTGSDFFRDCVAMFYIGNEGISILENTAIMGVPYPEKVKNALEILKSKGDGEVEEQ